MAELQLLFSMLAHWLAVLTFLLTLSFVALKFFTDRLPVAYFCFSCPCFGAHKVPLQADSHLGTVLGRANMKRADPPPLLLVALGFQTLYY